MMLSGLGYSDEQMRVINKKVDNLKTPCVTGYYHGLLNLKFFSMRDYKLVFFVLAFALAGLFSKDNSGGITELTLSSKHGRRRNLNARWIAGNLFAASVYLIYLALQIILNGAIGTLTGWNIAAQMFWYDCIENMTLGDALLIMFFGAFMGALVVGNIVMLLSIKLKNVKLAVVFSIIALLLINKNAWTPIYSIKDLLSPVYFNSDWLFRARYLFVGNVAVPYSALVPVITMLYVAVLYTGVRLSYKKYHIN